MVIQKLFGEVLLLGFVQNSTQHQETLYAKTNFYLKFLLFLAKNKVCRVFQTFRHFTFIYTFKLVSIFISIYIFYNIIYIYIYIYIERERERERERVNTG